MVKGRVPIIVEAIRSMRLKAVRCTSAATLGGACSRPPTLRGPCDLCGGEMKVERRSPGAGPRQLLRERRSAGPGAMPDPRAPLAG